MPMRVASRDISWTMHWLVSRETMIFLAVLGGGLSIAASALGSRLGQRRVTALSRLAYICMGGSMLLFVILGLMARA